MMLDIKYLSAISYKNYNIKSMIDMKVICLFVLFFAIGSAKIVYLAQLFRHGARYPTSDAFDGKDTKPFHGQLTNIGLRQQYLLGSYLRNQYVEKVNFLNATLNHHEIQVYSDMGSEQRCIYSAIAHLNGLYPMGSGYSIPDGIDKQYLDPPFQSFLTDNLQSEDENGQFALDLGLMPAPIYDAGPFFPSCPNQNNIMARRVEGLAQLLAQFQLQQAVFTQKMREIFNMSIDRANLAGLAEIYDVITCDKNLGRSLPARFTDQDYRQLKFIHGFLFQLVYEGQPGNVFSTPFVGSLFTKFDQAIDKIDKNQTLNMRKMSIFSRHDSDIVPLLSFLNLSTHSCIRAIYMNQTVKGNCGKEPDFAANIIFQLHDSLQEEKSRVSENSQYYIKIRYNGQYFSPCNDNQKICSYSKFKAMVTAKFVDFKKICGVKQNANIKQTNENNWKIHLFS